MATQILRSLFTPLGPVLALALVATLALPTPARATWVNIENIERPLVEILQEKRLEDAIERGDSSKRDVSGEEAAEEKKEQQEEQQGGEKKGRVAILPEIGFSPEKGPNGGIKFTDRDFNGLTIDLSGGAAMNGQYRARGSVVAPDLLDEWLILLVGGEYQADPTKEFFGLGNNDVGPDELSTHEWQLMAARVALGLRLSRRFTLVGSAEYNEVQIHEGDRNDDDDPFTQELFPTLSGINGGKTSPYAIALIFNDRDDVTRPIQGWSVIAKYQRVDLGFDNRFEFNRYVFEASYLYPLLTRRQVIGLRAGGEYIQERDRPLPFFELSSLGGGDDMRGYFLDRFLGKGKAIVGAEYRLKLLDFNFFDIWDVKIDGVGFADGARVFLDRDDVEEIYGADATVTPSTKKTIRFAYGGGTRIALGQAIIARIDVGFSDEEKGLVYLVFGHTF